MAMHTAGVTRAGIPGAAVLVAAALVSCTADESEPTAVDASATPLAEFPEDELLDPGDYAISVLDAVDLPLSPVLSVPEGYTSIVDGGGVQADDLARYVWVWEIDSVFAHPCDRAPTPVGPSAADLAEALAAQQLRSETAPVPVTIGGYDGFYVEVAVPAAVDDSACPGGVFKLWPGRLEEVDGILGQVDKVWIVDVDGRRLVFDAAHDADADPELVAELREMVTSATFAPADDS